MLRKKVLVGCALLCVVVVTMAAAPQRGWRGLFDVLLGEDSTHLVLVRGTVGFDAMTIAGGDFAVTRTGPGTYLVLYDDGTFSDTPTVLVQILGGDVGPNEAFTYVESETLVGFVVETQVDSILVDHSFKFIAVGPQ